MSPEARERSFDELARGLASGTFSRRKAIKFIAATTLGGILGLSGIGTAFAKNKTCAQWCAAVFGASTPAAGRCTSDAAHRTGLCSSCGAATPPSSVCCTRNSSNNCTSYSGASCPCDSGRCLTCDSSTGTCVGCTSGQTCVNGSCCPDARVCGTGTTRTCCAQGERCLNGVCGPACVSSGGTAPSTLTAVAGSSAIQTASAQRADRLAAPAPPAMTAVAATALMTRVPHVQLAARPAALALASPAARQDRRLAWMVRAAPTCGSAILALA
jgi:hypothetical protein